MGSRAVDVDREIRERRARIAQHVATIRERKQDLGYVSGDILRSADLERGVDDHPLAYIAGALGLGVILGTLSESAVARRGASRASQAAASTGSGLLAGLLAEVEAVAGDEVRRLVRQAMGGQEPPPARRAA
jgi:hypothetical protein